jgi:uncharacterized protein YjlB
MYALADIQQRAVLAVGKISTTAFHIDEHGGTPNNPRLPVIVYDAAFPADTDDLATAVERRFAANGWPARWRNGVYDFNHYTHKGVKS